MFPSSFMPALTPNVACSCSFIILTSHVLTRTIQHPSRRLLMNLIKPSPIHKTLPPPPTTSVNPPHCHCQFQRRRRHSSSRAAPRANTFILSVLFSLSFLLVECFFQLFFVNRTNKKQCNSISKLVYFCCLLQ